MNTFRKEGLLLHTTNIITSSEFIFKIGEDKADFENIFPEFTVNDRIGVIVKNYCGAIRARTLILSAVTEFYDAYRSQLGNETEKFRIYPDFFLFHIGKHFGDHQQLDIWPSHREIIIEDNPEKILETINDRGITRLIIEDTNPNETVDFLQETVSSAKHRIKTPLAYSPNGRVENADITAKSTLNVERLVSNTLKESNNSNVLSDNSYKELKQNRHSLVVDNYVNETYRFISLTQALHML